MHTRDILGWTHPHRFETGREQGAERRTKAVALLTVAMMATEITVGSMTNSMALLADGFHMSTHAGALGIAAFAYWHARRHAEDRRYSFGTGKVSDVKLTSLVRKHFDLTPRGIMDALKLRRPIYRQTATYGHFGRPDLDLPWERTERAAVLADDAGIALPEPVAEAI